MAGSVARPVNSHVDRTPTSDVMEDHVTSRQTQGVEFVGEEAMHPGRRILCTPASCYTEYSELQHSITGGKDTPVERA